MNMVCCCVPLPHTLFHFVLRRYYALRLRHSALRCTTLLHTTPHTRPIHCITCLYLIHACHPHLRCRRTSHLAFCAHTCTAPRARTFTDRACTASAAATFPTTLLPQRLLAGIATHAFSFAGRCTRRHGYAARGLRWILWFAFAHLNSGQGIFGHGLTYTTRFLPVVRCCHTYACACGCVFCTLPGHVYYALRNATPPAFAHHFCCATLPPT